MDFLKLMTAIKIATIISATIVLVLALILYIIDQGYSWIALPIEIFIMIVLVIYRPLE